MSVIRNRLEKNDKKIRPWAERKSIEAYRLYDLDIPEYPFLLDRYREDFVFYDRSNPEIARDKTHLLEARNAICDLFSLPQDRLHIKERARQKGDDQYERLNDTKTSKLVAEGSLIFEVNLIDYLDTGLFLDHRPLRERLQKLKGSPSVLNLFCYTGSLSVAAARSGARVTSVDMSGTYLDWAQRNFQHNGLDPLDHRFFREDILQFLAQPSQQKYDLILLDPPTFSNSKKMIQSFEVERDQDFLVNQCMDRLSPDGLLIFSNNKRKFRLSEDLSKKYWTREITKSTIPMDFHNQSTHCCFEIKFKY